MLALLAAAVLAAPPPDDLLLTSLQSELNRSFAGLKGQKDAPLYYLAYRVTDSQSWAESAAFGALTGEMTDTGPLSGRVRWLDTSVRVGTHELDSTHKVRSGSPFGDYDPGGGGGDHTLPVEDDRGAIETAIWRATDHAYKSAAKALIRVKANVAVKADEEDKAFDFSEDKPAVSVGAKSPSLEQQIDREKWRALLTRLSAELKTHPKILRSNVGLQVMSSTSYFVDSDGAKIREPHFFARLSMWGMTRAEDGMDLDLSEDIEATTPDALPKEDALLEKVKRLATRIEALRAAPTVEPYAGPAIITNRAAGVFFHEIFGHRVEGHRQKDADDGHTFTKRVGQQIVPDFIDVTDDPTQRALGGLPLNGFYEYDEEGQPAQKVSLVQHGVLKAFLMGRSPIQGFSHSNGHGRAMVGFKTVARQGNLIVDSSRKMPIDELRKKLIEEVKARGKPYGLWFEEISGGFTNTRTGGMPQAFKVIPQVVYRVYPDGRPDELVRGVDLVGTPISSFERILATGDDPAVFNGFCGAESGWVPVSAVAPSMLLSDIEVERKQRGHDRQPLLAPPPQTGGPTKVGER